MATFVSILIIAMAATTIITVFVLVMREKHEHYEHYIPQPKPASGETSPVEAKPTEEISG